MLPWFQPLDESRIDFKAVLSELDPTFKEDIMANFEVYSGLVMRVGWMIWTRPDENSEDGTWTCWGPEVESFFEPMGLWNKDMEKSVDGNA